MNKMKFLLPKEKKERTASTAAAPAPSAQARGFAKLTLQAQRAVCIKQF